MTKTSGAFIAVAMLATLLLTGCGETVEELADNRDRCEELGGTFEQWRTEGGEFSRCDFNRTAEPEEPNG